MSAENITLTRNLKPDEHNTEVLTFRDFVCRECGKRALVALGDWIVRPGLKVYCAGCASVEASE